MAPYDCGWIPRITDSVPSELYCSRASCHYVFKNLGWVMHLLSMTMWMWLKQSKIIFWASGLPTILGRLNFVIFHLSAKHGQHIGHYCPTDLSPVRFFENNHLISRTFMIKPLFYRSCWSSTSATSTQQIGQQRGNSYVLCCDWCFASPFYLKVQRNASGVSFLLRCLQPVCCIVASCHVTMTLWQ
jgi:hypothetical protein